ncbi:hypothetical protein LCGC14_0545760 [marine sediment metagenome]|uniref:Uncharacterized protein n=1 Tax=marine sediment metagenome TaxID=412755 RepID=A0A0F9UCP3_9ZZZZ
MNKEEEIKKFLEDLNKSDQGKKMLQEVSNPVSEVPVISEVKEKKKKKIDQRWWEKTFNKKKFKKPSKVAIVYLRNNGNADLMQVETRNGFFNVNGKIYHEDRDCVYTVTKDRLPLIILREWDLIPIGTKKWDDDNMREKFSELSQHVIKGIKNAELVRAGGGLDSKLTTKQIILWGLAALVGVVIVMNFI